MSGLEECSQCASPLHFDPLSGALPVWCCSKCGALHYDEHRYRPFKADGVAYVRRGALNVEVHPHRMLGVLYPCTVCRRQAVHFHSDGPVCDACGERYVVDVAPLGGHRDG